MKKYIVVLAGSILLSGCFGISKQLTLTPEGQAVAYIGSDLANSLPGRPLDKCKIIEHIKIHSDNPYSSSGCWPLDSQNFENSLRNETAAKGGNCVIFVTLLDQQRDPVFNNLCARGAQGIALSCDRDTLRAAGLDKRQ